MHELAGFSTPCVISMFVIAVIDLCITIMVMSLTKLSEMTMVTLWANAVEGLKNMEAHEMVMDITISESNDLI